MTTNPRPIELITSDWHMMFHAWKQREELCGDAECVLSQVVHAAHTRNLPILAAGDLFDSRQPAVEIMVATGELLRDIDGDYIMGNHDRRPTPWMKLVAPHWNDLVRQPIERVPQDVPENMENTIQGERVLGPLFETEKVWHIYGLNYIDYANRLMDELDDLAGEIEPDPSVARLLVLHQACEALMPVGKFQLTDDMIPDCFDLVVVGDWHCPTIFTLRGKSGRPIPCLAPGGFHLTSIREEPMKKLFTLYSDGGIGAEPLVTRRVINVDLYGMSEDDVSHKANLILDSVLNSTTTRPVEINRPIVVADLDTGTTSQAESILRETLGENVHLFLLTEEERKRELELCHIEDIDMEQYAATGYQHAKDVFYQNEPNPEVQRIVEAFLDNIPSASLYHALKDKFLNRHCQPRLSSHPEPGRISSKGEIDHADHSQGGIREFLPA